MSASTEATTAFRAARDFLLQHPTDYETAYRDFRRPQLSHFNWALDWFDVVAKGNQKPALWIVEEDGRERKWSFEQLSARSNQVANWLREQGVKRGDRVVLMLGNQVELWEVTLAAMKLGAVIIPSTTMLAPLDLQDRIDRGGARHVVVAPENTGKFAQVTGEYSRICVGEAPAGWKRFRDADQASTEFVPDRPTAANETLLLYFTSGTTSKPKLVEHTHVSYPVGHLSTMYWIGLRPGDLHLNISSPGWAKHAWSNVFAPWNAEATVFLYNYTRFNAPALLEQIRRTGVNTFCAPPTVWRMLIQAELGARPPSLRELVGAGEPLNPEVIERVEEAWGMTIRDGFGQTETTAQIANTPGQKLKAGSMGRPLPGYKVHLLDPLTDTIKDEGEICLDLTERPLGLMVGYRDDPKRTKDVMRAGHYHTGDVASRDADGYITYVGRTDDVFKSSDYRISPFELESVLIEHPAVAEAAVVPSPDSVRLCVPKAYVVLAKGHAPNADTAREIFRFTREKLAPYKRLRRLQFGELPKTISGKIRRVELRDAEVVGHPNDDARPEGEFRIEDFPELRG